jgi:hypothetical protein
MKTYGGMEKKAPLLLDPSTSGSGQLQAPVALFLGKSPPEILKRTLGGPQSQCGLGGKKNVCQESNSYNTGSQKLYRWIIYRI